MYQIRINEVREQGMVRIIAVRLPDDVYKELERRARESGYTLVADYVKDIIMRELGKGGVSIRGIEQRLSRIEEGDLPPRLYERIWMIAQSAAQELMKNLQPQAIDQEKLAARVARMVQDLINPWTAKVDQLAGRIAELYEKLEELSSRLSEVEAHIKKLETHPVHEQRHRRKTAIERLKEQGVIFESDVKWIRDRDAFFEKLRREGAIVIEVGGERVAMDRRFWETFRDKVEKLPTVSDEEIHILLTEPQYKLFRKLKEEGLIYFDSTKRAWRFIEEVLKAVGESEKTRG